MERALDDYRFMNLVGHEIRWSIVRSLVYELQEYFDRPFEQKALDIVKPDNYRGYIPLGFFSPNNGVGESDNYEGYKLHFEVIMRIRFCEECTLYGSNRWPVNSRNLRLLIMDYWADCDRLSTQLLGAFKRILGLKIGALQSLFDFPLTNMTLLYYPASEESSGIHLHIDTDVLTLLPPGLGKDVQIRPANETDWMSVGDTKDSIVANVGEMMEIWSGGRFTSTPHKVSLSPGCSRYSFPLFVVPRHNVLIRPLVEPTEKELFGRITAGELSRRIWTSNWVNSRSVDSEFDPFVEEAINDC
ncbi:MAG: 2OG-Fe(II) oxygenase family protein [Halieaceae bacterium]|nr:2OG-Fe(II) oxygenase family protein [Halieaceae bacterium]